MTKKTTFNNPDSQEREYTRLLLRYSRQLQADVNRVLLPRIDDIQVQYKVETRTDTWIDTLDALMAELMRLALGALGSVVTRLPGQFNAVSKFNEGQFKLVVKANTGLTLPPVMPGAPSSSLLGVNVFRSEPFLKPLAEGWISENTSLIKSLPTRLHPELEGIVRRGVMNGQSVKDIKDQIKARYGVTDYRAKLIAQDQILKLNADLTRYRLQSVGVAKYVWRSVQDSRVRPEHADRNGNEYTWKEGAGGEHPGQPVRCRCRAEAVWDNEEAQQPEPINGTGYRSPPAQNTEAHKWIDKNGNPTKPEGSSVVETPLPLITGPDTPLGVQKPGEIAEYFRSPLLSSVKVKLSELSTSQGPIDLPRIQPWKDNAPPIQVVIWKGQKYIFQGNHRTVSAWINNVKELDAYVLDLDAKAGQKLIKPKFRTK